MKISGLITTSGIVAFVLLVSTSLTSAQTLQTLYAFVSTNGCNPQAPLIVGADGNFYGTTPTGGTNLGYGTIFKVTTNGVLSSLFQFSLTNGASPYAGLISANDGCLYGTTEYGGVNGYGTIFRITTDGTFTLLTSFNLTNGANPVAGLTLGSDGSLYGTTTHGGSGGKSGSGTVFKWSTNGVLTRLASFNTTNGFSYNNVTFGTPVSGLVFGNDGSLYGTTMYGGTYNDGSVFRVTTNGILSFIASFFNGNGGSIYPNGLVLGKDGNFYCTAYLGYNGLGAIIKVTSGGVLNTIYNFNHSYDILTGFTYPNGCSPMGNLIAGNDGYLYGTASGGGTNNGNQFSFGTVFKISTGGSFTTLASLANTNGAGPYAGLVIGNDNNFYGTTLVGGDCGQGAVFKMSTNGTLTEFAPFLGSFGRWPKGGLTLGNDGKFYGTASSGGTNSGSGTIFNITTNGDFTSLISLNTYNSPKTKLTLASDGSFYSVLIDGTVFRYTPDGQIQQLAYLGYNPPFSSLIQGSDEAFYGSSYGSSGGFIFKVLTNGFSTNLVSFANTNGSDPQGGVCIGKDGNFYGTTMHGGQTYPGAYNGSGTVFKLTTNGALTTLKVFRGTDYGDGAYPSAGLCMANDGSLYGTTYSGGNNTNSNFPFSNGEVFKVATNGIVSNLASFAGTNGALPEANLVAGSDGNLYGTTRYGGNGNTNSGLGTIFRVTPKGVITALISFNRTNGTDIPFARTDNTSPQAELLIGNDGNLYGTTPYGGIGGDGTVFRVLLPPDIAVPLQNQTNIAGTTGSFTVGATSLQPMIFQWQKNGTNLVDGGNISGTVTTNLTITGVSDNDAGVYSVVVSNANFSVTNIATLTVIDPPSITVQPTNKVVVVGGGTTFGVSVSGTTPFTYQWLLNGINLPDGIISTVAGKGTNSYSGDGGAATNATLYTPFGIAVDSIGNLFIADILNNIRRVDINGIITTVAGNGIGSYSGDGGAATNANLYAPHSVAVDSFGNLFIADTQNNRIRKVDTNGIITTVAGNGTRSYSGDGGAATNATLNYPFGVTIDSIGNLFIADYLNSRIRMVNTNRIITTVAGNGINGFSGDGGVATNAALYYPYGVTVDKVGNLLISDTANGRIRRVDTNGIITTVAGNGTFGFFGDGGAATNAELYYPSCVGVDSAGNLFIADFLNNRIRRVDTNGIITTVAGNGIAGYNGDNISATSAFLKAPEGIGLDTTGNLFISDSSNSRIRRIFNPTYVSSASLIIKNASNNNVGNYSVVITGLGGSVTSSIASLIVAPVGYNQISIPVLSGSQMQLSFVGLAASNYALDRSFTLSPANWIPQVTNPADANGNLIFTNTPDATTNNFWRIRSVP